MDFQPANCGSSRDDVYGPYDAYTHHASENITRTLQPTVTGSSVIGIKFDKGVILAADNLASYGSLRRFTDQERLLKVGDETVVGIGGDISDLQTIKEMLENLEIENSYDNTGQRITAANVRAYLRRVMYYYRSKLDPLWNAILVAGFKADKPYLAYVDLLGVTYQSPSLATGFGSYLAVPLLRKLANREGDEENVSEEAARKAIDECMKVLFYRDGRALDKYTVATVTKDGVTLEENIRCNDLSWKFAADIRGFGATQS